MWLLFHLNAKFWSTCNWHWVNWIQAICSQRKAVAVANEVHCNDHSLAGKASMGKWGLEYQVAENQHDVGKNEPQIILRGRLCLNLPGITCRGAHHTFTFAQRRHS